MNELDPQVQRLLEQIWSRSEKHSVSTAATSSLDEALAARKLMSSFHTLSLPAELVSRTTDLEIPGPCDGIRARLYLPLQEGSSQKTLPALVYYHGGGFVAGSVDAYDSVCRALANRGRCTVLSVAYRLAPEHPYPAANDDAWTALEWMAGHAREFGADYRRLAVGGDSAGGLLAAFVAQKAAESDLALRLQLLFYPNLDATMSSKSWLTLGTGEYLLSKTQMAKWYDAFLPSSLDRRDPSISPLFASDLRRVAPALTVTADHDPLRDEGAEYAAKLRNADVAVEHIDWPGMIHGLLSIAGVVDAGKMLIDKAGAALVEALGQRA